MFQMTESAYELIISINTVDSLSVRVHDSCSTYIFDQILMKFQCYKAVFMHGQKMFVPHPLVLEKSVFIDLSALPTRLFLTLEKYIKNYLFQILLSFCQNSRKTLVCVLCIAHMKNWKTPDLSCLACLVMCLICHVWPA